MGFSRLGSVVFRAVDTPSIGDSVKQQILAITLLAVVTMFSACYRPSYDEETSFRAEPAENGKSVIIAEFMSFKRMDIRVPPKINNQPVTEIGTNAFADFELVSVILPRGIKKIGDWSFSGNYLEEITIPSSVTEIGPGAFMNNKLTSINIPRSVKKIGYRAFCMNPLTSITIGKNVSLEKIGGFDYNRNADWEYPVFELGYEVEFDEVYEKNGKKAGTYVLENGVWSMSGK